MRNHGITMRNHGDAEHPCLQTSHGIEMAKNSREGDRERQQRRRQRQIEAGLKAVTITVPATAKSLLHCAAKLMSEGEDPASALRRVGGGNEPPIPTPPRYKPWRDCDLTELLEQRNAREIQARLEEIELRSAADFGRKVHSLTGWRRILIRMAGLTRLRGFAGL
jgi:hypothetical protein